MRKEVRRITDAAMIAAIIGALLVIDRQLGFVIDSFLFWVIPIPIIIYMVKYGIKSGVVLSVSVTLMSLIISTPDIIVLVAFSALIALAYGYGINKDLKISRTLLLTFIATLIYYLVTMVVFAKFFGYDPAAEAQEIMAFFNDLFQKFTDSSNVITILRWINPFFAMLILFIPFLPIAIAFLQTLITHLVSSMVLNRLKLAEIKMTPVFMIKVGPRVGVISLLILIITYAYFILVKKNQYDSVIMIIQFLAQLIFISSGAIYLLSYAIFKQKQLLSLLVGLAVIFFPIVIMFVGIFDVFSNSREKMIRSAIYENQNRTN